MKSKILKIVLLLCLAFLLTSTVCFAANEEVKSTDIGNEITSSIQETQKSFDNVTERNADAAGDKARDVAEDTGNAIKDGARDAGNAVENGVQDAGNMIENGVNGLQNEVEDSGDKIKNEADNVTNAVSGETSNFTSGDTANGTNDGGMSTRTWVWIIIAVIAVIIIAAVWYYATNKND